MTSFSDRDRRPSSSSQQRRPSVALPQLAGLDRPTMDPTPRECDVLIAGSGLVESILAAALAWQGTSVFHVDANPHYGDMNATLNIEQLKTWVQNVNNGQYVNRGFAKANLYIPRPTSLNSRDYAIDLTPRILFARSDLLLLLIQSRVFRYLEFQALGNFHTFENDSFEKMASTKEDIFINNTLSVSIKRNLMKFMKFVLEWEKSPEIWSQYTNDSITKFLTEKFKLEKPQIAELVHSIGLCSTIDTPTTVALARIKRYLVSFDAYGNFPTLVSKFGGPGELSQGFCRSAAVAGATYKLNTKLTKYDDKTGIAHFNDGSTMKVNEHVVCASSQYSLSKPFGNLKPPKAKYEITRLIAVVSKDCKEWMAENENSAVVVFPPGSLNTNNVHAVHAIIMNGATAVCPQGQSVWYLSTTEQGEKARYDLEAALKNMEVSILRESTEDFEFDGGLIDQNDISFRPDGLPIIASVKLGQSLKDFVPKERLQYMLKLCFTQFTSIPPMTIINTKTFESINSEVYPNKTTNGTTATTTTTNDDGDDDEDDPKVIFVSNPTTEISYDGIVTEAKYIYEKLVGSDDDFFNVNFEDEDDQYLYTGINSGEKSDDRDDHPMDFGDEMEL